MLRFLDFIIDLLVKPYKFVIVDLIIKPSKFIYHFITSFFSKLFQFIGNIISNIFTYIRKTISYLYEILQRIFVIIALVSGICGLVFIIYHLLNN